MSKRVDKGYSERLQEACEFAAVAYSAQAIGYLIDENRQTVHHWISGSSVPSLAMHFKLSRKLGVDAEWLATGDGPGPDAALQGELANVKNSTRVKKSGPRDNK